MEREFHRLCRSLALLACIVCGPVLSSAQPLPPRPMPPDGSATPGDEPLVGNGKTPAETSPLVREPKTPAELFEATELMVGIARPDLAAIYFDKLLSLPLDEDTLLALRDRFGVAPILRLAKVKELKDSAEKLLELSNAAALTRAADPERALKLVLQLDGDDAEQRAAARVELQALGTASVPGLVALLADPAQAGHHQSTMTTLVQVGDSAVPMLIGALTAPDVRFKSDVVTVLGHIRSPDAAPYLWSAAFAPDADVGLKAAARIALSRIFRVPELGVDRIAQQGTASRLTKIAAQHYRHDFPWAADNQGRVTLWSWNEDRRTVVPMTYTPDEASDLLGLNFARQALTLAPESRKTQTLYLSLALAADARKAGLDKPLPIGPGTAHDLALSVGPNVVSDVLGESLASHRPVTAAGALRILEQIGTRAQMAGKDGKRSPVLAALDYPEPRVQFAAAQAILQFDPRSDFRYATRVVDVLKRAATAGSKPFAVVGEVSIGRGARVAGYLRELGYEPLVFLSGREAFRAASERGDVELVVLHPNIIRWALSETLANLRADSRTAGIPILIHGPGELESKMRIHQQNLKLVAFTPISLLTEDFEAQVRPILRKVKDHAMSSAERVEIRRQALGWLAHIASGGRTKVFDISSAEGVLVDALADPKSVPVALVALSEIPTQSVQRRMAELTLDRQAAAENRQAAALRLAFHLQRFGLLLSKESIDALHVAWKDDQLPIELRTAIGGVIGSLKPDDALVGKRLQAFPAGE